MLKVNNQSLANCIKSDYQLQDIQKIIAVLEEQKTFIFPVLENGLFPAAAVNNETEYTGYASVWVRDNIYLAYCHYTLGQIDVATRNISSLITYFQKFKGRFEEIIEGRVDPNNVMERPHIRFNGIKLEEINQQWNHAQNDALGYFLWFYCKLAHEELLKPTPKDLETLALFPFYFQAIEYWQDEDSGHWEEDRKIEASSIGVVVAGLKSLKLLLADTKVAEHCTYKERLVTKELLDELISAGRVALNNILPAECIQIGSKNRKYDAALLFLIYPLQIEEIENSDEILKQVIKNLQGDYGIRRYLGDSFWCRDYQDIPEEIRTTISSEREQWFKDNDRELKEGEEAQWCIFDPIVSAIFGLKFQKNRKEEDLKQQITYLNRSLGQITGKDFKLGAFKCPELYYLQNGNHIPNDATPLLWTQANLRVALKVMEDSLSQL